MSTRLMNGSRSAAQDAGGRAPAGVVAAIDADAAAVSRADRGDDRQPQPGALGAPGIQPRKPAEDLIARRSRDAGTVIGDGERHHAVPDLRAELDGGTR